MTQKVVLNGMMEDTISDLFNSVSYMEKVSYYAWEDRKLWVDGNEVEMYKSLK